MLASNSQDEMLADFSQYSLGRNAGYFSPTLERSIALALVENGPERMNEILDFPNLDGSVTKAAICDPVFFDKEGKNQNV